MMDDLFDEEWYDFVYVNDLVSEFLNVIESLRI